MDVPAPSTLLQIETHGCTAQVRRVAGPEAVELFVGLAPADASAGAASQAGALARAMLEVLASEGGGAASVVTETLFLRDTAQADAVVAARGRRSSARGTRSPTGPRRR